MVELFTDKASVSSAPSVVSRPIALSPGRRLPTPDGLTDHQMMALSPAYRICTCFETSRPRLLSPHSRRRGGESVARQFSVAPIQESNILQNSIGSSVRI